MAELTKSQRDNKFHVQAKLDANTYIQFTKYCKDHDFSYSRGIRTLIQTHPEIQPNV
jgi:homoserine acetyltransferase